MTYSKTHQKFSERLNQPDALTNLGKYLGPNWEDVLNFWIYLDSLSDLEKREMNDRPCGLDDSVQCSAIDAAWDAADEVVGRKFRRDAWSAVWDVTEYQRIFSDATLELIGSHKLLEQNKTPTFLPLCTKP